MASRSLADVGLEEETCDDRQPPDGDRPAPAPLRSRWRPRLRRWALARPLTLAGIWFVVAGLGAWSRP